MALADRMNSVTTTWIRQSARIGVEGDGSKTLRWQSRPANAIAGSSIGDWRAVQFGMLSLIIALVVFGLILYLINTYIPMAPPVKTILNVVIVIVLILWLCQVFGLLGSLNAPLRLR
jgi:hypothetical protein